MAMRTSISSAASKWFARPSDGFGMWLDGPTLAFPTLGYARGREHKGSGAGQDPVHQLLDRGDEAVRIEGILGEAKG